MEAPFKIRRPKGLADYILKNCAAETYLIFDRKIDTCVCTRCGAVKKISEMNDGAYLKHNTKHWCYKCGSKAICKEWRYGRKNITDYGRILYLSKRGKDTYAQLDEYTITYDKLMLPRVDVCAIAQYKFNKKEQLYYKYEFGGYWYEPRWEQRTNIKIPSPYMGMYQYLPSKYEATYFYEPSRSHAGTDLKYANLDMKRLGYDDRSSWEPYILIGYIYNFCKYQAIELLEKSGFERIVGDRARGGRCSKINWRGKTLKKILKMNNRDIKECRDLRVDIKDVSRIAFGREEFPGRPIRETITLARLVGYCFESTKKELKDYVTLKKAADYLLTQQADRMTTFRDYADYLKECDRLGLSMKDKKVLRPKDLQKTHKETSQKIEVQKDELTQINFKKYTLKITGMEEPYFYKNYLIRPAASPEELSQESKALKHCVRTYVDRVAEGRASILFIRDVSDPDKPLYTLELSEDRKVVQCRGFENRSYSDDIKDFIDHWMDDVINKKSKKAKKAA